MFVLISLLVVVFNILPLKPVLNKIKIKKISIGFGKALLSWRGKNGCQWIWARWPVGGYVQLLNSRIEPVSPSDDTYSFDKKSVWVRCVVLLSGAIANLLTAWFALVFMLMLGYQQMVPIIANIQIPSVASKAGLVEGDRIRNVAGQPVASWQEVGMQLIMALGHEGVDVVVDNVAGVRHQVHFDLAQWRYSYGKESLLAVLGIKPDLSAKNKYQVVGLSWWTACQHAFYQMIGLLYFFLVVLKQLLTGVIPFAVLLGPLGVFTVMVSSFIQGLAVFLYFIASLSLAVAVINLLPVPGLDGGSILYALIEKIRGKPVSIGMEILLHRLIFIAFCLILVQLLLNDAHRYLH